MLASAMAHPDGSAHLLDLHPQIYPSERSFLDAYTPADYGFAVRDNDDVNQNKRKAEAEEPSMRKRSSRITLMESKKRDEEERQLREEEAAVRKTEAKRAARERRKLEKMHAEQIARGGDFDHRLHPGAVSGMGALPGGVGVPPGFMGPGIRPPGGAQDMMAAYALFGGAGQPPSVAGRDTMTLMAAPASAPARDSSASARSAMEHYPQQPRGGQGPPPSSARSLRTRSHAGWTPFGKSLGAGRCRNTRRKMPGSRRLQSLTLSVRSAMPEAGVANGHAEGPAARQARLLRIRGELCQGQEDTVLHLKDMIKEGLLTPEGARAKLQEVQQLSGLALTLAAKHPHMNLNDLVHQAQSVMQQQAAWTQQHAAAAFAQQQQQQAAAAAAAAAQQAHFDQQSLLAKLSPEKLQQLRAMPRMDQDRVMAHLMQQQVAQQRQRQAAAAAAAMEGRGGDYGGPAQRQQHPMQQMSLMDDPLMMDLPNLARSPR